MGVVLARVFAGLVLFGFTMVFIYEMSTSKTLSLNQVIRTIVIETNIRDYTRRRIPDKPSIESTADSPNNRDPSPTSAYLFEDEITSGRTLPVTSQQPTSHRPTTPHIITRKETSITGTKSTVPPTPLDELLPNNLRRPKKKTIYDDLSRGVHHLVPKPSLLEGYVKVPNVDMTYSGDIVNGQYSDPRDAVRRCNSLSECKCFIAGTTTALGLRRYYMKDGFSFPLYYKNLDLYIKKESVEDYLEVLLKGTQSVCAIPIKHINVITTGCKLPVLDPFDSSIMKLVVKQIPAKCDGRLYTHFEKGVLTLADDAQDHGVIKVEFQPVVRPSSGDIDFEYALGKIGTLSASNTQAKIDNDYLVATVHFNHGHTQTDIHASVVEKPAVRMRKQISDTPLDIMIVGFDSMSAAHFQRMLPETFKFLKDGLKSDIFKGFSIVGEATTPALTAMLTGVPLQENCERHEGRKGYPNARPVDPWPFIFKDLHMNGFATMWSEDDSSIGSFHLRLQGFENPPVDHYAHNFWYYPQRTKLCHGSQIQFMIQFNYLKSFMTSYKGVRKFGFTFLSDLCHQSFSHIGIADTHVAGFLKSLRDEELLNNTMLVVMGDHGPRFGEGRETVQGKLEEALPFLSITLPQWFKEKYPREMSHLHGNTDMLISPFDLHATFSHLLDFSRDHGGNTKDNPGVSLFQQIPQSRSCLKAQIPSHFCPCIEHRNISTLHEHVQTGANAVVEEINRRLTSDPVARSKCSNVMLQKVINAAQSMPGKDLQLFHSIPGGVGLGIGRVLYHSQEKSTECDYYIQIITSPGGCRFEGSVRVVGQEYHVSKNIFRINAYGDQPKCISQTHPHLRDYCVCL